MEGMMGTALVKMGRWTFHWAVRKGGENFNSRLAGCGHGRRVAFALFLCGEGKGGGQDTAGRPGSTNTLFVWGFSYTPLVEVTAATKGQMGAGTSLVGFHVLFGVRASWVVPSLYGERCIARRAYGVC